MAALRRGVLLLPLFIAAAVVPAMDGAKQFRVGGSDGWALKVDYQKWAAENDLSVGDELVFSYNNSEHDVLSTDGTAFNTCKFPDNAKARTTGNDTITLATAGTKWYVCTLSNHCEQGLKLKINVASREGEAPSPSPTTGNVNAAGRISSLACSCSAALAAALAAFIML